MAKTTPEATLPPAAATTAPASTVDLSAMLAALLASQAETARVQRELLNIELAKQEAQRKKDADILARLEKERKQLHEQMQIKLHNDAQRQANCPHTDQRGGSTIYPISNSTDRQLRGTCTRCGIYIQPEHVETDGNGKQTIIPEHPLYKLVLQRDQALYAEFVPSTNY